MFVSSPIRAMRKAMGQACIPQMADAWFMDRQTAGLHSGCRENMNRFAAYLAGSPFKAMVMRMGTR